MQPRGFQTCALEHSRSSSTCLSKGLQLDDHFAWPGQFGYDAYTVALYRYQTGSEPPLDHTDRMWMNWRQR